MDIIQPKNVDILKSLLIVSYLIRSELSQAREERMQTLMQQCFTSQSFDCRRHASTSLLLSNPHNSHWGVQFFLQEQRNMVLDFLKSEWVKQLRIFLAWDIRRVGTSWLWLVLDWLVGIGIGYLIDPEDQQNWDNWEFLWWKIQNPDISLALIIYHQLNS